MKINPSFVLSKAAKEGLKIWIIVNYPLFIDIFVLPILPTSNAIGIIY